MKAGRDASVPKPQPRVVAEVCSLCGLDWKRHGVNPSTETCITLLLGEVAALGAQLAIARAARTYLLPAPYPVYPPNVYPRLQRPYAISGGAWSSGNSGAPAMGNATPRAITAGSG